MGYLLNKYKIAAYLIKGIIKFVSEYLILNKHLFVWHESYALLNRLNKSYVLYLKRTNVYTDKYHYQSINIFAFSPFSCFMWLNAKYW